MAQAKNGAVQNPERAGLIICLNLVVPKKFNKCAYIVTAADKNGQRLRLDGWMDYTIPIIYRTPWQFHDERQFLRIRRKLHINTQYGPHCGTLSVEGHDD